MNPRKKGQVSVLLEVRSLKQKDIAKKLNVSTQTVSPVKKNLDLGRNLGSSRKGNCGRKKKTTPHLDRIIKAMALKDRRLARNSLWIWQNNRILEQGLKAYRPRQKPR